MANLFLNLPAPSANAAGAAVDVSGMGQLKTIVVGGPFDAILTIEYATDDTGTNFAPIAGFQGSGHKTVEVAARWMRAVTSGYKSGAINVDVGASGNGCEFVEVTGAPASIASLPPFKTVVVDGGFEGAVNVEVSEDGVSWAQVFSFQKAGGQSALVYGAFVRATNASGGALPAIWMGAGGDDANASGTPPFQSSLTEIFANATGNDLTGDGNTYATAFKTFQRAAQVPPPFFAPGAKYKLNLTDLGDEELPEGYEAPAWVAGDFIFPFPGNAMTIMATMKPAAILTPSQRVFTPTAVALEHPVPGLWAIEDTSQSWPDLRGYYAMWGDPSDPLVGVIHSNNGTIMGITGDEEPFGEISIVEPSARLLTRGMQIHCSASLLIQGLAIVPAEPGADGLTISNCETWMERCTVERAFFAAPVYRQYAFNCDLIACSFNGQAYISGTRMTEIEFENFEAPPYLIFKSGTVFENIATISPVNLDSRWHFSSDLLVDGVLVKDALANGFLWNGGRAIIENAEVNACGENAFYFKGACKVTMRNVSGAGSAGVGIRVDDGAQVECLKRVGSVDALDAPDVDGYQRLTDGAASFDETYEGSMLVVSGTTAPANNDGTFRIVSVEDANHVWYYNPGGVVQAAPAGVWVADPITVTGSADQEIGNLGAAAYPPALPYNINDIGIPGTNAGGATGTNARMYNK